MGFGARWPERVRRCEQSRESRRGDLQVVGNTAIVRHLWVSQNELEGKVTDTKGLLAGLLIDAHEERLTPSHAVKKGPRYRYYVSTALITEAAKDGVQGWRLAAQEIEDCVISILVDALNSPARLLERLRVPGMPAA